MVRRITRSAWALTIVLIISGCSFFMWRTPQGLAVGESRSMRASFYGPGFHGRPTANGERFNRYGLTAAHRDLPFGTILRVTYPPSRRSVVVRVNDRGPYISGRDLDLSEGAAIRLGLLRAGVGRVHVRRLA